MSAGLSAVTRSPSCCSIGGRVVADALDVRDDGVGRHLEIDRLDRDRRIAIQPLRANVIVLDRRVASREPLAVRFRHDRDRVATGRQLATNGERRASHGPISRQRHRTASPNRREARPAARSVTRTSRGDVAADRSSTRSCLTSGVRAGAYSIARSSVTDISGTNASGRLTSPRSGSA